MPSTADFYAGVPILPHFTDVADPRHYHPLPGDWHVLISDVEGSTAAIRAGRYKDVNLLGASSIIGVINAIKPLAIPYVFGGDGAAMCVPASHVDRALPALRATMRLARQQFNITMRGGSVPVHEIRRLGADVRVARVRSSGTITQAAFSGGGLQLAERAVKSGKGDVGIILNDDPAPIDPIPPADYTGLECRWDSIPSRHGEIVTLLVQALDPRAERQTAIYQDVIREIERIYAEGSTPINEAGMHLTTSTTELESEVRLRSPGWSRLRRALYRVLLQVEARFGRFAMDYGVKAMGVQWGEYRRDSIRNSDFRKFDDLLRHVLSGAAAQREQLQAWLDNRHAKGDLAYGLHTSPAALMTCLIFSRGSDHVHFIDGADGGYAMASIDLKRRLASSTA